MIKLGSNVKSEIHDDLTGHVVIYQPLNNYAVVMTDICEYEMMTVECFLSAFFAQKLSIMAYCDKCGNFDESLTY